MTEINDQPVNPESNKPGLKEFVGRHVYKSAATGVALGAVTFAQSAETYNWKLGHYLTVMAITAAGALADLRNKK